MVALRAGGSGIGICTSIAVDNGIGVGTGSDTDICLNNVQVPRLDSPSAGVNELYIDIMWVCMIQHM